MRTTLRLDEDLLARAKKLAIDTDRTLTQVVEDALRMALAGRKSKYSRSPVKFHTCGGNGLQPGVDLSSNAGLADLMDQHNGLVGR